MTRPPSPPPRKSVKSRNAFAGPAFEDGDPHQEVRWLNPRDEARFEPGDEALIEVWDRLRRTIAGEDDLLLRVVQVVEGVEQLLVDLRHAAEELDVVDHQAIHAPNSVS